MILSTKQKIAVKTAGLATIATALVSFATNKMIEIQLNFWMLLSLLVVGIGVFVYLDLKGNRDGGK